MPALGRHFLTFLRSLCATPLSLPSWLSLLGLFFSLMCCFPGRLLSTLPVPVILYRFAAACMHGGMRLQTRPTRMHDTCQLHTRPVRLSTIPSGSSLCRRL